MKRLNFIAILLCFFSGLASADDVQEAFQKGDYEEAVKIGRASGSAEGLFLAARASLINGGYHQHGSESVRLLHQALDLIHHAERLDADDVNIRLTKAMAIGFEAKRRRKLKQAKQSRNILRHLAAEHPDDQMSVAALAAWHSEVAAEGFLARTVLNASKREAGQLFERASALNGDQPIAFALEHAKYLARQGAEGYPAALEILANVQSLESHEAFDETLKSLALSLQTAVAGGKRKDVNRAIEQATPFNGIENSRHLAPWKLTPAAD